MMNAYNNNEESEKALDLFVNIDNKYTGLNKNEYTYCIALQVSVNLLSLYQANMIVNELRYFQFQFEWIW